MTLLLAKKVTISANYIDFADVFSEESANVLLELIGVNKHAINLGKDKQPPYKFINSLSPVKLETFKTYIKTNLANNFILALKLPVSTPILLVHKPNSSFCLYINYQGLNNITIKNQYLLPLISKFFNWLG